MIKGYLLLGPVAQSVASPTVDPGVASLIPARIHTFFSIDHEITPPSADSRRVVTIESMCTKYWLTGV